jgi:hypothetical protein
MKTTIAAAAAVAILIAAPSRAQYSAPAGVQRLEVAETVNVDKVALAATRRDTVDTCPTVSIGKGIAGSVAGGVVGAYLGIVAGAASAQGCTTDMCGFGPALLGFAVGESIGVALGAHIGAGGRGNVALSSLASFGILVTGSVLAASVSQIGAGAGTLAIPLVPVLQIAAALALESR